MSPYAGDLLEETASLQNEPAFGASQTTAKVFDAEDMKKNLT